MASTGHTSSRDALRERWSFSTPSATLPGVRTARPSTMSSALGSSLVGGRAPSGAATRRVATPSAERTPMPDEESAVEVLRHQAHDQATQPFVTPDQLPPAGPARAATSAAMTDAAPGVDPYGLLVAPPATRRPARARRRRTPPPQGHPADETASAERRARQLKVGGISVLALVAVLAKVIGLAISTWHH